MTFDRYGTRGGRSVTPAKISANSPSTGSNSGECTAIDTRTRWNCTPRSSNSCSSAAISAAGPETVHEDASVIPETTSRPVNNGVTSAVGNRMLVVAPPIRANNRPRAETSGRT
ncbi:Uncharacterised protein [Mycobacteroides abscessus subsp. abscessus]|nr:Uncharacterised protein [Mycobacteroides abscessus subsp. abscessus]